MAVMITLLFLLLQTPSAHAGTSLEEILKEGTAIQEIKWRTGIGTKPGKLILPLGEGKGRYMVRFPKLPDSSYYGACGSFHYNPDSDDWIDAYAHPRAACGFVSLLQEWRKTYCPSSERGCRMQWGDISHKTQKFFSGHQTHTHGYCVDMRPFRKGDFSNTPLWWDDERYDRDVTKKFVQLIKRSYGASPIYFNDPELIKQGLTTYSDGHDNHLHFCLQNVETVTKTCKALSVNENYCPFFETEEML